ncbi:MAG: GIY-YIG nuclease family protein [Candidatus Glassbacteria bacterium]|nr:GIY-YIG nuclease family protein [Candidatus Glassbacteria bacterium]
MGQLGTFSFPQGVYIYTGSALGPGGLPARLGRHLAGPGGRPHWHVDYLSSWAVAKSFAVVLTAKHLECSLNRAVAGMEGSRVAVPGFGSSDCRCASHLYCLAGEEWPPFPGLEPWTAA